MRRSIRVRCLRLDTSDGNATPPDIITGFADSGGFILDTTIRILSNTGHGDSAGFVLDTGGDDGIIKTGMSNSGGFTLDTRDTTGEDNNQSEFGFGDSNSFVLDTLDDDNQTLHDDARASGAMATSVSMKTNCSCMSSMPPIRTGIT